MLGEINLNYFIVRYDADSKEIHVIDLLERNETFQYMWWVFETFAKDPLGFLRLKTDMQHKEMFGVYEEILTYECHSELRSRADKHPLVSQRWLSDFKIATYYDYEVNVNKIREFFSKIERDENFRKEVVDRIKRRLQEGKEIRSIELQKINTLREELQKRSKEGMLYA